MPSASAITWLNKRLIAQLNLPAPHTFTSHPLGWTLRFDGAGSITARTENGALGERIDVQPNDRLVCRGEDLFVVPSDVTTDL